MDAYSIRLVVQRQGTEYQARWIEESGQESAPFDLALPLTETDSADLRWYLEEFYTFVGAGTRVRARGVEKRIEAWGRQLFDACFGCAQGTHVHRNLLDAAREGRQVLLTLGSTDSLFLQQPWELMHDGRGPLAFQGVSIRRQLIGAKPSVSKSLRFNLPLRLLLIVARPSGAGFIDPRSSMAPLLDGLDLLPIGAVELEFCQPPTLSRLEELLLAARRENRPFHIIHFDGHGTFLPKSGEGALCFEDSYHRMDLVTGRRLGGLLAQFDIPLVMLEACRTSDLSDQPVFGSLAPALLESGVGSVVAFSHSVHVAASRILVECFYRELASGFSVSQALSESRAALLEDSRRWLHLGPNAATVELIDWFIPQLYQAGSDPVLAERTELSQAVPVKARPEERMFGFPAKPIYRFHGRDWDLLEMERAFERKPALLLTGGGGMGKTALAREAAYWWLRTGSFEQAVFVSFEQPTTVERVVQGLGRAFEGASFASRSGEEQWKMALAYFRERRVLLVWDNFESTLPKFQLGAVDGLGAYPEVERERLRQFYGALTQGGAVGRLLLTCRPVSAALPGIKRLHLGGLERHDSLHLVHAIAGIRSISLEQQGYEREEIEELLDLLTDHPLSISLVVPHLKALGPAKICRDFSELVEQFSDETAVEARNKSLLASLKFSTSRLSSAAQVMLPWLAWFQGGTFEDHILALTQISPLAWSGIQSELEETALIRVENLSWSNVPFVNFHPTLPYAANRQSAGDLATVGQRFVEVYVASMLEVGAALRGQKVAEGIEFMEREEANVRSALELGFQFGEREHCWRLTDTLAVFYRFAGRDRRQQELLDWFRAHIPEAEALDDASCGTVRKQAILLIGSGRTAEAVSILRELIARLEKESGGGDLFQLGTSYACLGEVFERAYLSDLAINPCLKAIEILKNVPGEFAEGNLSSALTSLSSAYRMLGRLDEALTAGERSLEIDLRLGFERNAAVVLDQVAGILGDQQRWAEAEARYREALALARRVGDFRLQGSLLQHQGIFFHHQRGSPALAAEFYEEAMDLFRQAGDTEGEMRTCTGLGSAEQDCGRLDEAEAWYSRATELAQGLGDESEFGNILGNLGILYQCRADIAVDTESRYAWLSRALASAEEGLEIWKKRNDQVLMAKSHAQIGTIYLKLGQLNNAKASSMEALSIREALDLPELFRSYEILAEIAEVAGDSVAAADWVSKGDAKRKEIELLHNNVQG